MPFCSIDTDNNMAAHPDKEAAIKEAGATGAAFAAEAELSEATASWPASRLIDTSNSWVLSEKCSGTCGPLNAWGCGLTGGEEHPVSGYFRGFRPRNTKGPIRSAH
jgi:hypothetical protein